ncbi:hypothetical protein T10_8169 [Trichinella papuae]|uniref:Uncharacterized protein n=1 Tax=Trichinella papuae TaxID=268474 RepID=A0A0V1M2A1_9BILA|nr:hypothetical protein T10_8169 [Trichinella papuae]
MNDFLHLNLFMSDAWSKNSFAETYGHCFFVFVDLENIKLSHLFPFEVNHSRLSCDVNPSRNNAELP